MVNKLGYNVKAGVNYNLNANHNVFFNTGYYEDNHSLELFS